MRPTNTILTTCSVLLCAALFAVHGMHFIHWTMDLIIGICLIGIMITGSIYIVHYILKNNISSYAIGTIIFLIVLNLIIASVFSFTPVQNQINSYEVVDTISLSCLLFALLLSLILSAIVLIDATMSVNK